MKRIRNFFILTSIVLAMVLTGLNLPAASAHAADSERPYAEGQALVLLKSGSAKSVKGLSLKEVRSELSLGKGVSVDQVYDMGSYDKDADGNVIDTKAVPAAETVNVGIMKVSSDSLSTADLIKKLRKNRNVQSVCPNYVVKASRSFMDEPYGSWLWGMDRSGGDAMWDAPSASPQDEQVIAVIDTGIDYTHEDLKDKMWHNPFGAKLAGSCGFDFVNEDSNPMDDNGHGSHCAGIIGGLAGNNAGIAGVSGGLDNVRFMALKFLDEEGSGYLEGALASYAYIAKAQSMGVNVVAINNSWGSSYKPGPNDDDDEWEDDEESEEDEASMMKEAMNAVGAGGALSVCAAGNAGEDNDHPDFEWGVSPCDVDSDYVISVAATANGGDELASFSNYGANSVDLAAPGGDILSSVCYNNFNASLYFDNPDLVSHTKDTVSPNGAKDSSYDFEFTGDQTFEQFLDDALIITKDYSGPASGYAAAYEQWQADGENMDKKSPKVSLSLTDGRNENFKPFAKDAEGHALKIEVSNVHDENGLVILAVPYAIQNIQSPHVSAMVRGIGPAYGWSPDMFVFIDGKEGMTYDELLNSSLNGYAYLIPDSDTWDHVYYQTGKNAKAGDETKTRYTYLVVDCENGGDDTIYLDDLAVSATPDEEAFGKYDFYSGTSMATPYVTGSVAAIGNYISANSSEEITMTPSEKALAAKELICASTVREDFLEDKCITGGALSLAPESLDKAVAIFSAKMEEEGVVITGTGLDKASVISIESEVGTFTSADMPGAFTITPGRVTFTDPNALDILKNRMITITAEGSNSSKRSVFLAYGKKDYTKAEASLAESIDSEGLFTDGRKLYSMYFDGTELMIGTFNGKDGFDTAVYGSIYGDEDDDEFNPIHILEFNITESEVSEAELASKPVMIGKDCYALVRGAVTIGDYPSFSSEYTIIKVDMSKDPDEEEGLVTQIALPKDTPEGHKYAYDDTVTGQTLGLYNGKLYLMGGYDYEKNTFSKFVFTYDPKKNEWTQGTDLPIGRFGGEAVQTGNKLVYALGTDENSLSDKSKRITTAPAILVFDGEKWEVAKELTVNVGGTEYKAGAYSKASVELGNNKYTYCDGSVNLIKDGVLLTGTLFDGFGDTVIYNAKDNTLTASAYNFITDPTSQWMDTAVLGDTLYGIGNDGSRTDLYKITDKDEWKSGLVKAGCKYKKRIGKVTGANTWVLPGTPVTLKAKAAKGHYFKKMTAFKAANGKDVTVKAGKNKKPAVSKPLTFTITENVSVKAVFGSYVTKIKLNKKSASVAAGKTLKLKAKISPKNADSKKVSWKSSNKKYAAVSAKGVVKALPAGKGKTVKITCKAKDGSGKKAVCKVKIK